KQNMVLQQTLFAEITQEYTVTFPQVMRLSDKDANTIKDIYKKGYERKDYNIILALSNKLVELLDVKPQMRPEEFIDVVITDSYCTFRDRYHLKPPFYVIDVFIIGEILAFIVCFDRKHIIY